MASSKRSWSPCRSLTSTGRAHAGRGVAEDRPGMPRRSSGTLASDQFLQPTHHHSRVVVFPDSYDSPAGLAEGRVNGFIAVPVTLHLALPVLAIPSRSAVVIRATVPEASIDEDRHHRAREDHVGSAPQPGKRSHTDPVAKPDVVRGSADGQLRGCVSAAVALHGASRCRRARPRPTGVAAHWSVSEVIVADVIVVAHGLVAGHRHAS